MFVEKWQSRQLIWVKLVVMVLLLGTSSLMITACQQSDTESESTEQEADGQQTEADKQTEDEPQTEADKKYEEEGKDTTDDDDPE